MTKPKLPVVKFTANMTLAEREALTARVKAMNAEPIDPVVGCMKHDRCRVATAESDAAKAHVPAYEEPRRLSPEEIADRDRGYIGTVHGRASSKPQKRTLVVCIDIDGMHDHGVETLRAKLETLLENMSVNHSMKER
jgi:hypothetical protein